jgi:molybdopterin biosynthesis enzyme
MRRSVCAWFGGQAGKPTVLGAVGGKPVIGLPGHPVSAYFVFLMLAAPLIRALGGYEKPPNPSLANSGNACHPTTGARSSYRLRGKLLTAGRPRFRLPTNPV